MDVIRLLFKNIIEGFLNIIIIEGKKKIIEINKSWGC